MAAPKASAPDAATFIENGFVVSHFKWQAAQVDAGCPTPLLRYIPLAHSL